MLTQLAIAGGAFMLLGGIWAAVMLLTGNTNAADKEWSCGACGLAGEENCASCGLHHAHTDEANHRNAQNV